MCPKGGVDEGSYTNLEMVLMQSNRIHWTINHDWSSNAKASTDPDQSSSFSLSLSLSLSLSDTSSATMSLAPISKVVGPVTASATATPKTSQQLPLGVQNADETDNWLRLFALVGLQLLFFVFQTMATNAMENSDYRWSYTCLFWLMTFANGLYCGLGFFGVGHEATHRLYFRSRFLNDWTGGLCFAMVGVPFLSLIHI